MLSKATNLAVMVVGMLCLAGCGGSSTHLAYVTLTQNNTVAAYRINNSTGAFTSIVGSPYFAGNSPSAIVISPSKQFVYVANQIDNNISLFKVDSNIGSITEVMPRTPTAVSPVSMVMNAAGTFLFVSNAVSSSISVYAVDSSSGALSQISGSPFATLTGP